MNPTDPEISHLLTEKEVNCILKNNFPGKNILLCDFVIERISESPMGFLGEHYKLAVSAEIDCNKVEISYFIKTIPRKNPKQFEYTVTSGAFEKEIITYDMLFDDIKKATNCERISWHPEFFYSRSYVLVLENLVEKGFKVHSVEEPLDLNHVKIALKTLASMHGESLVFEEQLSKGKASTVSPKYEEVKKLGKLEIKDLYPAITREIIYNKNDQENPFTKWMNAGVYQIADAISELLDGYNAKEREIIRIKVAEILYEAYTLVQYSNRFKNVYNEGDLWLNNMLFRYENEKPVEARIVDYQLGRYAPPACDVMELLYLTTTRELRNRYESEFQKYYYEQLESVLKKNGCCLRNIISWTSFAESWEYYRKMGLIRAGTILNIVLTPANVSKEGFSTHDEYEKFILNERSRYIKKCFEYEFYKKRISETFYEMIERYILK